ncbi:GGDEF domain-containing protein [Limnobacter humi]|uniref:diguanylate cyclase n=1 Tax=Limnobacter humi TaxID=1778671 RepID=A0ABT1WL28_9BURK|nr:GGDEF domain-containing protein [Limnobacter humi]MCQ8897772.1 GGDEF domain-containing protein [Limnobacter humi]
MLVRCRQRVVFAALAVLLVLLTPPGSLEGPAGHAHFYLGFMAVYLPLAVFQWVWLQGQQRPQWLEKALYLADVPVIGIGLWLAPVPLAFSSPLVSVLALIRGMRYGPRALGLHCLLGGLLFVVLWIAHPFWRDNPPLLLSNLFLLGILPFHFYRMSRKIHENSRSLSEENLLDPLTRAFNRKALEQALWAALAEQKTFMVGFIDLDNFKQVNDTLGHHWGDKLLRRVCVRLQLKLRTEDRVYRLSGDEFVVLSQAVNRPDTAACLGQRIRDAVLDVVAQVAPNLPVSASVGVLVQTRYQGLTAGDVLRAADELMYQAKRNGKNQVVVAER